MTQRKVPRTVSTGESPTFPKSGRPGGQGFCLDVYGQQPLSPHPDLVLASSPPVRTHGASIPEMSRHMAKASCLPAPPSLHASPRLSVCLQLQTHPRTVYYCIYNTLSVFGVLLIQLGKPKAAAFCLWFRRKSMGSNLCNLREHMGWGWAPAGSRAPRLAVTP